MTYSAEHISIAVGRIKNCYVYTFTRRLLRVKKITYVFCFHDAPDIYSLCVRHTLQRKAGMSNGFRVFSYFFGKFYVKKNSHIIDTKNVVLINFGYHLNTVLWTTYGTCYASTKFCHIDFLVY